MKWANSIQGRPLGKGTCGDLAQPLEGLDPTAGSARVVFDHHPVSGHEVTDLDTAQVSDP